MPMVAAVPMDWPLCFQMPQLLPSRAVLVAHLVTRSGMTATPGLPVVGLVLAWMNMATSLTLVRAGKVALAFVKTRSPFAVLIRAVIVIWKERARFHRALTSREAIPRRTDTA